MAHGTSLARPTTSELMKFAMRPKNSPNGVAAEAMSAETGKVTYFEGTPIPTSVTPS